MIGLNHYLIISGIMFCLGLLGVIKRQNLIMLFFSSEILLNSVNIALVAISVYTQDSAGQIFALFIIAVAAAEVAIGLGLLAMWYRRTGSIEISSMTFLRK